MNSILSSFKHGWTVPLIGSNDFSRLIAIDHTGVSLLRFFFMIPEACDERERGKRLDITM
jgi:hypothetical protein